jgi:hypothetical protein
MVAYTLARVDERRRRIGEEASERSQSDKWMDDAFDGQPPLHVEQ